jgi:adenylate cyclase class 1
MSKNPTHRKPDPARVHEKILANRKSFIIYNVARLRGLIGNLSSEKLELFYSIPLLLHMNSPDLPGYVDHPKTPHGVYRFFDSGFWKLAKKRLRVEDKALPVFILKRSYVRGLYLVGGPGVLHQTDDAYLNYWVVIDRRLFSGTQEELFREKLARIKSRAEEAGDHNLSFFVLDVDQMRRNTFPGMDQDGAATLPPELLKEEFYRTFILIAGQIPYWAVLPPGLNDNEYKAWIDTASLLPGYHFVADDYVDLGNLISIKSERCLAGLISEIFRAQENPVKTFIEASVMAYHYFFQEREGLLCNLMKERYPERGLDSHLLDSYVFAFSNIIKFYEFIDDKEGLDLVRECIYLQLIGYPALSRPDGEDFKGQILRNYVKTWSWTEDDTDALDAFGFWREDEKLQFENRITNKLFFLCELVFRSMGDLAPPNRLDPNGAGALKNIRDSCFKTKPGKLPRCSAFVRAQRSPCPLRVTRRHKSSGADVWEVYHRRVTDARGHEVPLFVAPELVRVLGWMVLNELCKNGWDDVVLQNLPSSMSKKRTERLLEALLGFFSDEASPFVHHGGARARPSKAFVALNTDLSPHDGSPRCADYLVRDTWGGMFFYALSLSHIENNLLKCYEIAKRLRRYVQGAVPGASEYRIYEDPTMGNGAATRTIEDFIQSFGTCFP